MTFFPSWPQDPPLRRIFVNNLVLPAHIGVYDFEHGVQQRVRINVSLGVVEAEKTGPDDLSRTVSYAVVVDKIKEIIDQRHFQLVETLAETLAAAILEDQKIIIVRIKVEKLDILPEAEGVGVEIERKNP